MTTSEIKKQRHTVIIDSVNYNSPNYRQQDLTLGDIVTTLADKWKDKIEYLRSLPYHSDEQHSVKIHYPCWMVSGTFPYQQVHDGDIVTYSNIIALDIDKVDNQDIDIENIKQQIFDLPYVFYVSKSISGEGIYALVLVEDGKKSSEYAEYITALWKQKFNIVVDKQAKGIARKRFISYDENAMIKPDDTDIKPWKLVPLPPLPQPQPQQQVLFEGYDTEFQVEMTCKAIWLMLDNGYTVDDRGAWYHVGCEFANFKDGKDMFQKLSDNYSKTQNESPDKKWNECLKAPTGITNELHRKWQGMAKNTFGPHWWRKN